MIKRILSCALSPNTDGRDVLCAFGLLLKPWQWKKGNASADIRKWFFDRYHPRAIGMFTSGRGAFFVLLQSFGIQKGDEVIIQAFSCVAVPNSIRWTGAVPVYCDVDETLNIDPSVIKKKITSRTKAIVVQHTFGTPADMDAILRIADAHGIYVIEDCAHAIGASYKGNDVGTIGDASFFSFGRDKAVSSVWGGAAMILPRCRNKTAVLRLKRAVNASTYPPYFWIFQQLLHPVMFALILPTYRSGLGKVLLVVLQRIGLLSLPVSECEKQGILPDGLIARFPNALAQLLLLQLLKLESMVKARRENAARYDNALSNSIPFVPSRTGASYLRLAGYSDTRDTFRKLVRNYGVLTGNWYHHVIDPGNVSYDRIGYIQGSCPNAERAALRVFNLPTLLTKTETEYVIAVIKKSLHDTE